MSFLYDQEIKQSLVVCDCNHLFVIFMRLHKVMQQNIGNMGKQETTMNGRI
jgi:hypothetical protein